MMNEMNYQEYDVIQNLFDAIEKENLIEAQECLAGNFTSVILKKPVKGTEFIEVYRRIKEGMPDVKFKIVDLTTDGESFKANVKISGTHSKTFPALMKGWRSMKPTRRKINTIVTSVEIVLRGNQIMEIRNINAEKGVIAGLLDQLNLLPKSYSKN
ncbi:MAG: nuclear transport factor 2 family protein [Chitinophagaceae bacterium]|nr:nuclear transport factor 2 family protein [Chitinophagaceae bacterium]